MSANQNPTNSTTAYTRDDDGSITVEMRAPITITLPQWEHIGWSLWVKNPRKDRHMPCTDWDGRSVALLPPDNRAYEVVGYDG
jgi:hypothetical protein